MRKVHKSFFEQNSLCNSVAGELKKKKTLLTELNKFLIWKHKSSHETLQPRKNSVAICKALTKSPRINLEHAHSYQGSLECSDTSLLLQLICKYLSVI